MLKERRQGKTRHKVLYPDGLSLWLEELFTSVLAVFCFSLPLYFGQLVQ
jgi:hypothetical protein